MRKPPIEDQAVDKTADSPLSLTQAFALLRRAEKDRDKFRDEFVKATMRLQALEIERDYWKRKAQTLMLPVGNNRVG